MKTYTAQELAENLEKHGRWLRGEPDGERADLSDADLSAADLRGADLHDTKIGSICSLWGTIGNMREIKSLQCDTWIVTYTSTNMQIGCQLHAIADWWQFSDDDISQMDVRALDWWRVWKPILQRIIEVSPAVPGQ